MWRGLSRVILNYHSKSFEDFMMFKIEYRPNDFLEILINRNGSLIEKEAFSFNLVITIKLKANFGSNEQFT